MRNGIKKLFLTSLFVIFGMCINSSFADTTIIIPTGSSGYPSPGGYNTNIYLQEINNDGTYTLTKDTTTKNLLYGYIYHNSSLHYPRFWFMTEYNNRIGMAMFDENRAGNNIIWYDATIYNYTTYQTTAMAIDGSSCQNTTTGNNRQCYKKAFDDFGEEYNGKLSGIYWRDSRNNNRPCLIYEELNEIVCPRNLSSYAEYDYRNDGIIQFETFNNELVKNPTYVEQPQQTTTETTTIIGQCPTINEILSTYSSNYNTGICYSASRLLTQTGIVNTTAQSIFELYPTFTGWLEDYNYYRQYCENVPTSVCREAFSGNEIKWSLLNKTPDNNPIGVYQYCHLQLNIQDKNATTCVLSTGQYYATGVDKAIEEEIQGNQSVLDIMLNSFNNLKEELPSFSSGTVFDEFLEEGETWKDGFKLDIFKTFLELWSKITSIFIFRNQYDGIIPGYITSIIIIILLFKILKK